MKRRNFVKNVSASGGGLIAGINPILITRDPKDQTENGNILPATFINAQKRGKASCRLKLYQGKPTVFVNDKPCFPLSYLSQFPQQFRYKNMYNSGTGIFGCYISLGDRFAGFYKNQKVRLDKYNIWYAPGKIDFDIFDKSINEIFEVAPDAYILPRISCNSPSWWDSYHPAETCRTYENMYPQCQSFSSLVWRQDTADVLRKIVQHVYRSSYADRFIGMHICVGETNESVHLGWLGSTDYSLAAQNRFKEFLLEKYSNNHNLIKQYFQKSLDQISIPLPGEREKTEFGDFLDPEISKLNIDYRFFRCTEIIDSLNFFGKAVKEESNGDLLTGTFYGHTFAQWLDHMAFSQMLKSPYIDFFASTTWGTDIDSIKKANKLFYNEGDERTCVSKWISEMRPEIDPYHEYDLPGWIRPDTPVEKSIEHLKSEFAHAVCTGTTIYWYDLWGGWYDHDKILNFFNEAQKVADESIHQPGDSVAEICVIVDEKSFLYVSSLRRQWVNDIPWISMQRIQIEKLGAPYDIYLIEDLEDLDISKYKMIIFFNTFILNRQERQMIAGKCMCNNRILLWFYAPGIINDQISIDNISSLVKMNIGSEVQRGESDIKIKLDQELSYKGSKVSPFIYVKNGEGNIIGQTRDGYAVLAEKKEKNYTSVLASLPPLPWQVIQYYAKKAGVHIYSDAGDIVYGNQSYLSVKAAKPGKRVIHLPGKYGLLEQLDSDGEFRTDKSKELKAKEKVEIEFKDTGSVKFFRIV